MTLQQLKYFVETIHFGSISKAAENLYISQPSLSHALGELEAEIDCNLLTRSSKGVSPTNDGAEFLGYARQVLEQANLLEQRWLHKRPARRLCSISTQ
ncbi:MAG: LysR family transcriptional regulator, partial [Sphaerochaetaceae bacterium]